MVMTRYGGLSKTHWQKYRRGYGLETKLGGNSMEAKTKLGGNSMEANWNVRNPLGLRFDPSCVLYLKGERDASSFMSDDAYGHLCTKTGALWTPQGYAFDGDDKITVPDHPGFNFGAIGDFTLACWFRKPSPPAASQRLLYKSVGGNNPRFAVSITATEGYLWGGITNAGGVSAYVTGTLLACDGQWHLGTFSVDRDNPAGLVLLLDTQIQGTADPTAIGDISTVGNPVYIGTKLASDYYVGDIGEVWIYARSFSFLEKVNLYLATKWRYQ